MRKTLVLGLIALFLAVASYGATPVPRLIGEEDINKGTGTFQDSTGYVFHKVNASTFKFTLDNTKSPDSLYGLTTLGNWKMLYTDGSGVYQPLGFGIAGQYLMSNGASAAPAWGTPAGGGDMLQAVYDPTTSGRVSAAAGGTGLNLTGQTGVPYLTNGVFGIENPTVFRDTVGLTIGTNVQQYSSNLATLSSPGNWRFYYSNGSGVLTALALGTNGYYLKSQGPSSIPIWDSPTGAGDMQLSVYDTNADGAIDVAAGGTGAKTAAGARTSLGIGTLGTQNADAVSITGGSAAVSSLTRGAVTDTMFSYLSGVSSNIQTQLNAKAPLDSPTFTGTVGLPSTTSIGSVGAIALSYVSGATSNLQTQITGKQASATNLTSLSSSGAWKVFYTNGSGALTEVALGADNTYLRSNGVTAAPTFSAAPGGGGSGNYVADNVAITGGTINGTAIGGSTPAAGAFSSLTRGTVSDTEFGYLDGVTSPIQTQLNTKQTSSANLNTVSAPNTWRLFYSNGSSTITELTMGTTGYYLQANGATAAPTWSVPTGSGDMLRSIYDTNTDSRIDLAAGGTGANTAAGARANLGLGTISTQNASAVALTGGTADSLTVTKGTIDNAVIGGNTKAAGSFTTLIGDTINATRQAYGGELILWEALANGNEYRGWKSPDALSDNILFRFPSADPTAGQSMSFGVPAAGISEVSWTTFLIPTGNGSQLTGLTKAQVGLGAVENTALSTWAGSGNITAIGSLLSGTVPYARTSGVEASLGNPASDNWVLQSTAAGARSWVAQSTSTNIWPVSGATDNAVPLLDNTTGKLKNSPMTMGADNILRGLSGVVTVHVDNTAYWEMSNSGPPNITDNGATYYDNTLKKLRSIQDGAWKQYIDNTDIGTLVLSPTGSAASLTNFPTLNQSTSGTAAGLGAQYIDWNSGSGGSSIANKPTVGTLAAQAAGTLTNGKYCTWATGNTINCNSDGTGGGGGTTSLPWDNITSRPTIRGSTVTDNVLDNVAMYPDSLLVGAIGATIDGGGSAITTGIKGDIIVPYNCTITSVTLLADQAAGGNVVVDLWKDIFGNYPPTVADNVTGTGTKPTITTGNASSQQSTFTDWTTTTLTAGDIIRVNVDSSTTVTRVLMSIAVRRR